MPNKIIQVIVIILSLWGASVSYASDVEQLKFVGNGTGWITHGGYVVTSAHVVKDHDKINAFFYDKSFSSVKVVAIDYSNDIAVLKLEKQVSFAGIPINYSRPRLGESVFTIGYPKIGQMGTSQKFTDGKVSSLSGVLDDPTMLQISVPIQPGNSGGPLIDMKGSAIGVITASLKKAQNANYAVKSIYVRGLLDTLEINEDYPMLESSSDEVVDLIQKIKKSVVLIAIFKAGKQKVSRKAIKRYALTVRTTPSDARVRILNIRSLYRDGILLEPGDYHIDVSRSGYVTKDEWIHLGHKDLSHEVELESLEKPVTVAPTKPAAKPSERVTVKPPPDSSLQTPSLKSRFGIGGEIYFKQCAGCHGVKRGGAIGKPLTTNITRVRGTRALEATITYGTQSGMPSFEGHLNANEIKAVVRFIQDPVPDPPELSIDEIRQSHRVFIPPEQYPSHPMHDRNWQNFFLVILRDSGKVAIIDGDQKKVFALVNTGHGVHIAKGSSDGRFWYVSSRSGLISKIDLWMSKPQVVAEVKTAFEARSIAVSLYGEWKDKYILGGAYSPSHFTIVDAVTMEPIKNISTAGKTISNKFHDHPRVSTVIASYQKPEFFLNMKESGEILTVDYSDIVNLKVTSINAAKFLHNGGWDRNHRYFMSAANKSNIISVVDSKTSQLVKNITVGKIPHPGRGANLDIPGVGPVWATSHLGDKTISFIGTDPDGHPKNAWKVVKTIKGMGTGSLFIKTHPRSKNLWVDAPLNSSARIFGKVAVFDINNLNRRYKVLNVVRDAGLRAGRVLQPEYNAAGDEVWISVWNGAAAESAIVVYDDKTRKVKAVIKDRRLVTPTGKFNVWNTHKDIY